MPGQAAYIKSSSGAIEKVDSKDLAAALAEDDGASVATKSEVKHAQNQEKYGTGVGAGLKALGAGALRGATLGASDYLARKASPELADQLAYLKEDQGLMSGIGEVGGMVIPSLLSGGAGAAAEGASALGTAAKGARLIGAPARALTAAGDIAEHGIASLVGSGAEGLIARSLQKGASIAGRGVLEGGILGAANEISEASLGDHELTAERILASAGHGAILGGLVGGGLGIGAELVSTGTRKLASKVLEQVSPETLSAKANEFALDSLGPTQGMVRKADKYVKGGAEEIGRYAREDLLPYVEEATGRKVSNITDVAHRGEFAEGAALARKSAGKNIGSLLDESQDFINKASDVAEKRGLQMTAQDLTESLEKKLAPQFEGKLLGKSQMGQLKDVLSSVHDMAGGADGVVTLRQLKDWSAELGKRGKFAVNDPTGAAEVYQAARGAVEDELKSQLGLVAKASGKEGLVEQYAKFNKDYQVYKTIEQMASRGTAAAKTNQALSLTDKIMSAGGTSAGATIGSVLGPLGAAGGAAIGNFVGGVGSKLIRSKFDQYASEALSRASKMQSLAKLSVDFDKSMEGAISSLMTKHTVEPSVSAAAKLWGTGKKRTENIEKTINNVVRIAHDPPRAIDAIANRVNGLSQVAPNTAAALSGQAARSMMYLYSNLPQSKAKPSMFNPSPKPFYSETDVLKFANRLMAVEDPTSIIENLRKGQLQPESVEAVKTVYPKLFADMQNKIMQQSLSLQSTMPYEKQVQLGMLFGVPVNPTLEPDFMRAVQGSMVQSTGQQTQSGGLPPVAQNKSINSQYSTEADKLEGDR